MSAQAFEILLVGQDEELADLITQHVETSLEAHVTCVRTVRQAMQAYAAREPQVVLSDMQLPDGDGLHLARQISDVPGQSTALILMTDNPTLGRAVEAMRIGVRDLFTKPFDICRLSYVIAQEAEEQTRRRRNEQRAIRLRQLARQVIRDRRDLRRRVDLVCRDLVHAYRRLAKKVAEQQITEQSE